MDNPSNYDSYRYIHAKSSWMSAIEDFRVVKKLAETGEASGNVDALLPPEAAEEYRLVVGTPVKDTSDFLATVPALYLLTDGIDLMIKAFFYAGHPKRQPRAVLKTAQLLQAFAEEFGELTDLQTFVATYTDDDKLPPLFASFLAANEMSVAEFLKGRSHLRSAGFFDILERYRPFSYRWEDGRVFYAQLSKDLERVIAPLVELQTDIDSDGNPGPKVLALKR
jgi:hypothetical protein